MNDLQVSRDLIIKSATSSSSPMEPVLALKAAMEALVNDNDVRHTKYGEELLGLAATLNTSAAPASSEDFCASEKGFFNMHSGHALELRAKHEAVRSAHEKLREMWRVARIAFHNKAKRPAINAARSAATIRASNANSNPKRTKAQIAASNEKAKANEKARLAKQRQQKYDDYHAVVKQVRKDAAAAQPLGAIDSSGACKCPAHVFCDKCPAVKQARGRSEAEDLERRFHASTNVGCGMELADADFEDLIKQWIQGGKRVEDVTYTEQWIKAMNEMT